LSQCRVGLAPIEHWLEPLPATVTSGRTPDQSHTHVLWTAARESNPPVTSTQPGRAEAVDQVKQVAADSSLRNVTRVGSAWRTVVPMSAHFVATLSPPIGIHSGASYAGGRRASALAHAAVVEFLDAEASGQPLEDEVTRRRVWPFNQEQVTISPPSRTAERRLVDAELDRPRLLDLFGESEWYQLADRALQRTADAYRTWVKARASSGYPRPSLGLNLQRPRVGIAGLDGKVAAARDAVDAFAEAVEGWQASLDATTPASAPPMANQHPGACRFCAGWLAAGEGILVNRRGSRVPAHGQTQDACPPSDQRKPAPPRANMREGA